MKHFTFSILLLLLATSLSAQTEVVSPITESTTWTLAGSPYILGSQYVEVYNDSKEITLTIEEGVVVQGEYYYTGIWPNYNHSRLEIGKNAKLLVKGTSSNQVLFTKNPNGLDNKNWGGILFSSDSRASASVINNARFEYAGGEVSGVIQLDNGDLTVTNCEFDTSGATYIYAENGSDPTIDNCSFDRGNYGIYFSNSGGSVLNCEFDLERIAIELDDSFPEMKNNIFANDNFVRLNDLSVSGTLYIPGVLKNGNTAPYSLGSQYVDLTNSILTIEKGVVVEGEYYYTGNWPNYNHSRLVVGENSALVVNGTSAMPVVFTKSPFSLDDGNWGGIVIADNSRTSQTSIENAIFEYAGGEMAGVIYIDKSSPFISHVKFDNSSGTYIYADSLSNPVISYCSFENINYGIYFEAAKGRVENCFFDAERIAIELNNSFPELLNNCFADDNFVRLNDLETSGTLKIPGMLKNGNVAPYSLGPQYVDVTDATLTIAQGVRIEGEYYYTGIWPNYNYSRLYIGKDAALVLNGQMGNPIVFSKSPLSEDEYDWGGVIFGSDANFTDSKISYTIFAHGGGEVAGVLDITGGEIAIDNCIFKKNYTGIALDSSAIVTVNNTRFLNHKDEGLYARNSSEVTLNYCFADSNKQSVEIESASLTMDNVTIQNCSSDAIELDDGIKVVIDNSVIKNSQADGIWIPENSVTDLTVTNTSITGNYIGVHAYMEQGSSVTINNSEISGNTEYGVRNRDQIVIDAKNNWWGDPSGPYDNSDDSNDPTKLYNPDGKGDEITDYVDYGSWLDFLETESPNIVCLMDVPNDQGRWVRLCWSASLLDVPQSKTPIIKYSVWRQVDPDMMPKIPPISLEYLAKKEFDKLQSEGWDFIHDVTAVPEFDKYYYVAPTLGDSTDKGIIYSTFMVIAHTANPSLYYKSKSATGYSIDNLAPMAPKNLAGGQIAGTNNVELLWGANREKDFSYYNIYKDSKLLAQTTDTTYVDENSEEKSLSYNISAVDLNGNESELSDELSIVVGVEEAIIPTKFSLSQNYPNPFNPTTIIKYGLPVSAHVVIKIFDVLGNEVISLVNETQERGMHKVEFNSISVNLSSGIYFYSIRAGEFSRTKKMLLIK